MIIKKSVDLVKARAELQAEVRKGAQNNYNHVKSKVARCIKVQKKVAKRNKSKKAGHIEVNQVDNFEMFEEGNSFNGS